MSGKENKTKSPGRGRSPLLRQRTLEEESVKLGTLQMARRGSLIDSLVSPSVTMANEMHDSMTEEMEETFQLQKPSLLKQSQQMKPNLSTPLDPISSDSLESEDELDYYQQFEELQIDDSVFKSNYTDPKRLLAEKRKIVRSKIAKQQEKVERMMQSAPFWRTTDKICFVLGSLMIMGYIFVIGRYPYDHVFTYYLIVVPGLIFSRVFHYIYLRYHFYMIDFCYFANCIVIYYMVYCPKDEQLFKVSFVFANGVLAASVKAFRNSLVYHKFDFLTSLAIHAMPLTILFHIKWCVMPDQRHLPVEDQKFSEPNMTGVGWNQYLYEMLWVPFQYYLIWATIYSFINFVAASEIIKKKQRVSLYIQMTSTRGVINFLKSVAIKPSPLIFMCGHFGLWLVTSLIAILCYENFWINLAFLAYYIYCSLWNGSCYYMDYFARKYEMQLQQLQKINQKVDQKQENLKDSSSEKSKKQ